MPSAVKSFCANSTELKLDLAGWDIVFAVAITELNAALGEQNSKPIGGEGFTSSAAGLANCLWLEGDIVRFLQTKGRFGHG